MTIYIRETGMPSITNITAAQLTASGRKDGAALRVTLSGAHPAIRPTRVEYQGADIGGNWVTTAVRVVNRRGVRHTEITMRPATSRAPGALLHRLQAGLATAIGAEYKITTSAQDDYDAANTSEVGIWGYILAGYNAPAANRRAREFRQRIAALIADSVLADQGRYDDAARALWASWHLIITGQLLGRPLGLRSALSPVTAHTTAGERMALPALRYTDLERETDYGFDPATDRILVPFRVAPSDARGVTWRPVGVTAPADGAEVFLVYPSPAALPVLGNPLDTVYTDAYLAQGLKDGLREAQLAGRLQAARLGLASRLVTATARAPETRLGLDAILPGQAVSVDGVLMWVVDMELDDNAGTIRLTLCDPT